MMKRFLLAACVVVAFAAGYGVVTYAYPSGGVHGRAQYRGYFTNTRDTGGWEVLNVSCSGNGEWGDYNYNNGSSWCNAIPSGLNSASRFIRFIEGRLANGVPNGRYGFGGGSYGDRRAKTGAAMIVHTMLGTSASSRNRPPTGSQMAQWRSLVNQYADAGLVRWSTGAYTFNLNSYFQGTDNNPNPNDDAFYDERNDGLAIVFRNPSGGVAYALRRECGNPVGRGSLSPLQDFNIDGRTTVNGGTSAEVLPGDRVDFRHSLINRGPTGTSPTRINWSTPSVGPVSGNSGNAGTFNDGQTKRPSAARQRFTVPANATPGTRYCSQIFFNPNTENGGNSQSSRRCAEVQYDFDLNPRIEFTITDVDGQDVTAEGVAEAGFTIEFRYRVRNGGLTESRAANCTYRQDAHGGHNTSAPTQEFTPPGANCPPATVFPRNSTTQIATETISGGDVATNTTICRSLTIEPATQDGGSETVQSCIPVVAKPYTRVYGGDVSAGNGFAGEPNVCNNFNQAAIVSWNRRAPGSFAGAGAQYAALALDAINDFSTDLGNSGSDAPDGLSFANNGVPVDANDGEFGGFFGDVPCISNYYGERPDGGQVVGASPNLSSLGSSGEHTQYVHDGPMTLNGGNINPGERITLYVDGNVFINGNINYPGSWSVDDIPVFRLVVDGNIYIGQNVSQLDGLYVSQGNGSSSGVIYTCATGNNSPVSESDGNFFDQCNTKLTVNGSFVATQVRLLRNHGTLSQSQLDDYPPGTGQVGEVFNYSPTMWLNHPPLSSGAEGDYDAVISLPPIL